LGITSVKQVVSTQLKGDMVDEDDVRVSITDTALKPGIGSEQTKPVDRAQDRVAVFIDLENLVGGYDANRWSIDFAKTFALLGEEKTIVHAASYACTPAQLCTGDITTCLDTLGITRKSVIDHGRLQRNKAQKNAVDFEIYLDAIGMASTREDIGTFVIMSSDQDFRALAVRLKAMGKSVIVAFRQHYPLPSGYEQQVDRVIMCQPQDPQIFPPKQAPSHPKTPIGTAPPDVRALPRTYHVTNQNTPWAYCAAVTRLFQGPFGEAVSSRGANGLPLPTVIASLTYLIPKAKPSGVGLRSWQAMLRFALPEQFVIVPALKSSKYRVVDRAFLSNRETLQRYSREDLGDLGSVHPILNTGLASGRFLHIIRWCAETPGPFTGSECQSSVSRCVRSAVANTYDTFPCFDWLLQHGFLTIATSPSSVKEGNLYMTTPDFSELAVLIRMVAELERIQQSSPIPLGPKSTATLDAIHARIAELSPTVPRRSITRKLSTGCRQASSDTFLRMRRRFTPYFRGWRRHLVSLGAQWQSLFPQHGG